MLVTRGTLLANLPDTRFSVVRIDGEWRARAMRPGAAAVEVRSASLLDVIRRVHSIPVPAPTYFAAVGLDDFGPCVYGVGTTPEGARSDAMKMVGGHGDLDALEIHPITEAQAKRVLAFESDDRWPIEVPS